MKEFRTCTLYTKKLKHFTWHSPVFFFFFNSGDARPMSSFQSAGRCFGEDDLGGDTSHIASSSPIML